MFQTTSPIRAGTHSPPTCGVDAPRFFPRYVSGVLGYDSEIWNGTWVKNDRPPGSDVSSQPSRIGTRRDHRPTPKLSWGSTSVAHALPRPGVLSVGQPRPSLSGVDTYVGVLNKRAAGACSLCAIDRHPCLAGRPQTDKAADLNSRLSLSP